MPRGWVILPGLSEHPPEDVEDSHPQAGLLDLLAAMGAAPGDVLRWDAPKTAPNARLSLLEQALLPAALLGKWRNPGAFSTDGLFLLEPDDQQHEAVAIALILRDALQIPGKRAALITPAIALAEDGFILQQGDVDMLGSATADFKRVPAAAAIVELNFLGGRKRLDIPFEALVSYDE